MKIDSTIFEEFKSRHFSKSRLLVDFYYSVIDVEDHKKCLTLVDNAGMIMDYNDIKVVIEGLKNFLKITSADKIKQINEEQLEHFTNEKPPREEHVKTDRPGFIYIVKFTDYFKIGKTINMQKRMGEYTKLPEKPQIIMCEEVDNYSAIEEKLHTIFDSKRVRGEWFNLSEKDLKIAKKMINKNKLVPA